MHREREDWRTLSENQNRSKNQKASLSSGRVTIECTFLSLVCFRHFFLFFFFFAWKIMKSFLFIYIYIYILWLLLYVHHICKVGYTYCPLCFSKLQFYCFWIVWIFTYFGGQNWLPVPTSLHSYTQLDNGVLPEVWKAIEYHWYCY